MTASETDALGDLIEETFPELDEIEDSELRAKVVRVWTTAIEDNDVGSLPDLPWGAYHDDIEGEGQIDHIRQVTQHAISMADQATEHRPDLGIDRDAVVAAALLHDVSKLYEMTSDGREFSELVTWIPHPLMAIYVCTLHDVPFHIQRIVVAHTHQTAVQPSTIEGQLVKMADLLTLESLSWEHRSRPHNVIRAEHYPDS